MAFNDEDWAERPIKRLERLETAVAQNTKCLERLQQSYGSLETSVGKIQITLENAASEEMAELRRRADLPFRLLRGIVLPIFVGLIITIIGGFVTGAINVP